MNKASSYRHKAEVTEKILAFSLFLGYGMDAVERMYPQHVDFVRSNVGKTRTQVKEELLHSQAA